MPVPVDDDGLRVDALARAGADAVVVTPAHQHPTGAVLSGERRTALLAWLRERDAVAIEDDYDAEYRYDRAAVGALQGLDPDRVVYAGSASKTLAPALRLGWLVVPPRLLERGRARRSCSPTCGTRRGSSSTRSPTSSSAASSTATCAACAPATAPAATRWSARSPTRSRRPTVRGIAAGLHVTVELPGGTTSGRSRDEAAAPAHRAQHDARLPRHRPGDGPPTLMLGYAQMAEPAIRAGVRELAAAVRG